MKNKYVMKYLKSDLYRYTGKTSRLQMIKSYLIDPVFRFHVALRFRQAEKGVRFIGNVLWFFNKTRRSIQISPKTKIGYGLYIGHGGPIVVNPTAIIGNNVNLSQYTTIGSNHNKAATIGDFTYIGPNVCIVEDVKIGSNVTIGAGSVVTKDIPDNATAVGNYAKVINYDNPGRYTKKIDGPILMSKLVKKQVKIINLLIKLRKCTTPRKLYLKNLTIGGQFIL